MADKDVSPPVTPLSRDEISQEPDSNISSLEKPPQIAGGHDGNETVTSEADADLADEQPREHRTRRRLSDIRRKWDESKEKSWWFASTAIPLLAATLGPLANVLSIAALVTSWRIDLYGPKGHRLEELSGIPVPDPRWIYWINVVSLVLGFIGNLFLLFNFTNRIRYIISLPATIILWYIATFLLMTITLTMEFHYTPQRPEQTYSQGYWYAVMAAVLYFTASSILLINMLGYLLGHYPQTFALTESQRQLILQTMFFFFWLAAGGGIFSAVESHEGEDDWTFVDALYFCDVTILTVGFGDLYPTSDAGRGIVFPYSVVGIILLGLVISSINGFVKEIGAEKVIMGHIEKGRIRTIHRSVSSPLEMKQKQRQHYHAHKNCFDELRRQGKDPNDFPAHPEISLPMHPIPLGNVMVEKSHALSESASADIKVPELPRLAEERAKARLAKRPITRIYKNAKHKRAQSKIVLLREERDRFNAMRDIQNSTELFKKYSALSFSLIAFGILWCVGAVVFWQTEKDTQNMTYFRAIYFGYVSLLTIGYGDLAPQSNAGRSFFFVWSLIAVPTMTVLVSDLGNTVISSFQAFSVRFSNFYLMPEKGAWRDWLNNHPWLLKIMEWLVRPRWLTAGSAAGDDEDGLPLDRRATLTDLAAENEGLVLKRPMTLDSLAKEAENDEKNAPSRRDLATGLALSIRQVAGDLKDDPDKFYSYEEWVAFSRLIRFTAKDTRPHEQRHKLDPRGFDWKGKSALSGPSNAVQSVDDPAEVNAEDIDKEMVEWDWIGPDSPMTLRISETEFVLDRLCESLVRYLRDEETDTSKDAAGPSGSRTSSGSAGSR